MIHTWLGLECEQLVEYYNTHLCYKYGSLLAYFALPAHFDTLFTINLHLNGTFSFHFFQVCITQIHNFSRNASSKIENDITVY